MDAYVFDASALLNFGQRGRLQPLLAKFGGVFKLLTTPDVVGELTDPDHREFNEAFIASHFTVQSPGADVFDLQTLARFAVVYGPGEISVMALSKELRATAVLDERAARTEAGRIKLKLTGTLGLLNEAKRRGWLTDSLCLEKTRLLRSKGFRIPDPGPNQTFTDYLAEIE